MCKYLFILVTFVYVIKTSFSQEYDDVDYNIKEENVVSDESNQVDTSYKKVENEAKFVLNNVKDNRVEPKRKSSLKQVSTENEVDISSEIETMMNKIRHSIAGNKKSVQITTSPPGEQLRRDAIQATIYAKVIKDHKPNKNTKSYDSDEIKMVKSQKDGKHFHREDNGKSKEVKIEQSPEHRNKPEPSKARQRPVISDFYKRNEFHTTVEPECKICKNSGQSESQEQSEEVTKAPKLRNHSDKHIKRGEHKTREAKLPQISKHCNDDPQRVKNNAKAHSHTGPVTNSGEIRTPKYRKNNQQSKAISKSANEKLATICETCQKFALVEPYANPKEARRTKNQNVNSKEEDKSVESTPKESTVNKSNKLGISHKNDDREEMDNSEETKSTPYKHHSQIGDRTSTANDKEVHSKKHHKSEEDSVEIETLKSKPCKYKESSEEHEQEKPCKYLESEIADEGNGNETNSAEISDTQPDFVERIEQSDETNGRNATTSGEIEDKVKTTTEEIEEKKSKTLVSYPFSVSIQRKGAHYATGALLDKTWILTVAGEFYNVRETIKLYKARLGSVNCKRGGTLVALKRIEIHPKFIYKSPNFDIALIMIAKPLEFTDMIKPIGLSSVKTKVISAKFMTTYWSRVIIKGQVLPITANERIKQTSLRVSTQKLIPWEWCDTLVQIGNTTLDSSTLCLRPIESHHTLCTPDAGAPVVAEDGLWGITSGWTSKNCRSNPSPTVFTRVSSPDVRSWLDSKLK